MKIQCDVCEKAPAVVICCADEAALCARCDVEVHAANKLASKHQRLLLQSLSSKLPPCDICQEKPAFIFCVEDRALFCQDCDEPIHSANSRAAGHQRFLATGIRVALSSNAAKDAVNRRCEPPKPPKQTQPIHQESGVTSSGSWGVDELLQLSADCEKGQHPPPHHQIELGELDWLAEIGLFGDSQEGLAAAEVPQLPASSQSAGSAANGTYKQQGKFFMPHIHKKPRIEIPDDDEEFFTVPDLG